MNKELLTVRSFFYGLLSNFFIYSALESNLPSVKKAIQSLMDNSPTAEMADSLGRLADVLESDFGLLVSEADKLFYNPFNVLVPLSASYYEEGREFGKKLITAREILWGVGIEKNEDVYTESEDTIGFLLSSMHTLIQKEISEEATEKAQLELFSKLINPFVSDFTELLSQHPNSVLYKDIAVILDFFVAFERESYGIVRAHRSEKANLLSPPKFGKKRKKQESSGSCEI